jgi:hypothetical protein
MKTKTQIQNQKPNSGLLNRPEQLGADKRPKINFAARNANRSLDTESLLQTLRKESAHFYQLAEVVGKWVWITFNEKQPSNITSALSELGFHWNNKRQSWQHPCGTRTDERANYDPRRRYGSFFVADVQTA